MIRASHPASVALVRRWVRFEHWWTHLGLPRGRGMMRRCERLLRRMEIITPVRVDLEPGISLLLDPDDYIARSILISRAQDWENEVWAAIAGGLSAGAVFVDVGANIGYDSLKAARLVGSGGRVLACEPSPATAAKLRDNVRASAADNVTVLEIACSEFEGELRFYDASTSGNSGTSSLSAANAGVVQQATMVRARPLDMVVEEAGLNRLDVLKIDVEGAELQVLKGARATVLKYRPRIVVEVIPRLQEAMGSTVEELEVFIRSLGYDQVAVLDHQNKMFWMSSRG